MKTFSQSAPQSSASQRLLIDVREPSEFADGHIPTAHNLPLNSASEDFYLPADQFAAQYGFEKPGAGQEVVFYCKRGIRSGVAVDISGKAGWEGEVGEYKGSWVDWVQREGDGGGKGEGEGVGKTVEKPVGYQPPTNDGNTPDLM